jgi:hypothetical protein
MILVFKFLDGAVETGKRRILSEAERQGVTGRASVPRARQAPACLPHPHHITEDQRSKAFVSFAYKSLSTVMAREDARPTD